VTLKSGEKIYLDNEKFNIRGGEFEELDDAGATAIYFSNLSNTAKNPELAIQLLSSALELKGSDWMIYQQMGIRYAKTEDRLRAFYYFQRSLWERKENPSVLLSLGILFQDLGVLGVSEKYFLKAYYQAIEKRCVPGDNFFLKIYIRLGGNCLLKHEKTRNPEDFYEAKNAFDNALIENPYDLNLHLRLADIFLLVLSTKNDAQVNNNAFKYARVINARALKIDPHDKRVKEQSERIESIIQNGY
jgi:hypothetical protein